jgi:DNA polymerase I-like protein with 3'-5' exonuclease and polymerase domains
MPLDAKIINLVHDSILVELPQDMDVVREVVKILEGVMRQTPIDIVQAKVPFEAEFKYGTEWGNLEEVV